MKMQTVKSPKVPDAPPQTWTNCKVYNGHIFVSGTAASGPNATSPGGDSMYEQTRITFQKIKDCMEAAGGKMNDIISLTIFVTNLDEREEVWRARREFFTGDFPCCTLVEVVRVASPAIKPGLKVEINAMGFIGAGA
jgi:2-iminobutanoate/2-iminopropanoate deaminase